MRSGTSVPGPRTSITSGPFCTESIQTDARSTRGAAGLRLAEAERGGHQRHQGDAAVDQPFSVAVGRCPRNVHAYSLLEGVAHLPAHRGCCPAAAVSYREGPCRRRASSQMTGPRNLREANGATTLGCVFGRGMAESRNRTLAVLAGVTESSPRDPAIFQVPHDTLPVGDTPQVDCARHARLGLSGRRLQPQRPVLQSPRHRRALRSRPAGPADAQRRARRQPSLARGRLGDPLLGPAARPGGRRRLPRRAAAHRRKPAPADLRHSGREDRDGRRTVCRRGRRRRSSPSSARGTAASRGTSPVFIGIAVSTTLGCHQGPNGSQPSPSRRPAARVQDYAGYLRWLTPVQLVYVGQRFRVFRPCGDPASARSTPSSTARRSPCSTSRARAVPATVVPGTG